MRGFDPLRLREFDLQRLFMSENGYYPAKIIFMLSNFTVTMIIRKKLPILGHLELNCVVNDQLVMNDTKKRKKKTVVSYLSQLYS